jgi:hypothetical protein
MEDYERALDKAKEDLKIADHMINVTFRLVNDQKILLSVLSRLMDVLVYTIATVLYYERLYKRIPPFPNDFATMFDIFKARCTRRYHINIEYITLVQEVKAILEMHKKSPVVFKREGNLIICSDNYTTLTISPEKIINYINKAKLFIREAEHMVAKNA